MHFGPHLLLAALEGLVTSAVLALTALGLSLVFGVMRVVNVAHGEFFMLGVVIAQASTAPSMKNSPWATLTTRMTPNTSDSPSAVSASTAEVTSPSRAARRRCGPKCIG